jgi:Rod binding domain-containing protein
MKITDPRFISILPKTDTKVLSKPKSGTESNPELLKLRKACQNFESIFISYMLKSMRKASEKSDLFGSGLGSDIYDEMFDEKLAEEMADSGQVKIGDILYNQYAPLVKNQKKAGPVIEQPAIQKTGEDEKTEKQTEIKQPGSPKVGAIPAAPDKTIVEISKPQPHHTAIKAEKKEIKSSDLLDKIEGAITDAADKFGLNPDLLRAVIKHESGGNPQAVSPGGAKGLMQLIDSTAKMLGVINPFDPVENIMGGAKYLSQLIDKFGGDLKKALASYNAGPAAVEKFDGIPPYKETKEYVEKVLATFGGDKIDY